MSQVPISESAIRGLWADYDWYQRDPVGLPSIRLEQLCSRIEVILGEYKTQRQIDPKTDPYRD